MRNTVRLNLAVCWLLFKGISDIFLGRGKSHGLGGNYSHNLAEKLHFI